MKTSELQGAALDWAVAKCEGYVDRLDLTTREFLSFREDQGYEPSTDWAQGGPIIEREKIATRLDTSVNLWIATAPFLPEFSGTTPLIAAMRCYAASKLGDEIEVPEELLGRAA